jgi:tetraacyldisaccharide 4'-kinase
VLDSLYSTYRRAARAGAHRLARPVISIGNIGMGGRGKSPVAGLIARILIDAGERPAILSRGYGRQIVDEGVTIVSDGGRIVSDVAHSGDEPMMLARTVSGAAVLVCEERALAGTLAERALGCTVHVLDDGFQHHQLHRDIDIVILSDDDLLGWPMPFGRLREPLSALHYADAVVFDGAKHEGAYTLVRRLEPATVRGPVFAVAGIAKPDRFFDALKTHGYTVAGHSGFGDHHNYSAADVRRIGEEAARAGASAIVTTSKDMVRLEQFSVWPMPLVEVPLKVSVEPAAEFRAWLLGRLAEVRG